MAGTSAPESIEYNGVWYDRRDTVDALASLLAESRGRCETLEGVIREYRQKELRENPTPPPQVMDCSHPWASQDEIGRPYCAACGAPWQKEFGCPVCNGDCASANPPVSFCPMENFPSPTPEESRG